MKARKLIVDGFLALFSLALIQTAASAQAASCKNVGIARATVWPGFVEVQLGLGVTAKDGLDKNDRWRIIRISPGVDADPPAITNVEIKQQIGSGNAGSYYIDLKYSGTFEPKKTYIVAVDRLTFDGCDPGKEAFSAVSYRPTPSGTPPVAASQYDLAKTTDRSKADIYISGNIEGVRTDKAVKTVDLKVQLPFSISVLQKDNIFIPYLDLKYSSNKKANADSLNIGAILRSGTDVSKKGLIRGVVWDLDGRIEGNSNLKFINGIVGNRLSFVTASGKWCGSVCNFYIQPFVGVELGKNMRSPVIQAKEKSIARPLVGATAYLGFPINRFLLDTISLQSEYIRRWSLTSEVGVDKAGDKYVPVYAGRGPRDYVNTKLDFAFNDYMSLTIGHTYGSLPPNFKLIDHKYSIGMTFKSLIMKRPKP